MPSDRGSEGRGSEGRRSVGGRGRGGEGGGVCVKGKERQNDGQRAARCRAGVKGGGVRGEERRIEG
jgi:hypothetical protein